jgi:CHAT domain-containing protein
MIEWTSPAHADVVIAKELEAAGARDCFELATRPAATPMDLLRELRKLKPAVVHFSGCGSQDGLYFEGPNGEAQRVSGAALAQAFSAAGASVKLVVLNACYSESQAEALLPHVDCVVGVSGLIGDDSARSFAIGFYGGLGERASVAEAFQHGRAAISLEGLPDGERPRLLTRSDIDASALILAP